MRGPPPALKTPGNKKSNLTKKELSLNSSTLAAERSSKKHLQSPSVNTAAHQKKTLKQMQSNQLMRAESSILESRKSAHRNKPVKISSGQGQIIKD